MKRFLSLAVAFIAFCYAFAENQPTTPPPPPPTQDVEIPIIKDPKRPIKFAPAKRLPVYMSFGGGMAVFDLPVDGYPVTLEIIQETTPFGYWTATFTDAASCEMPFDGTVGDYRLTLTTADNSTYTGYFTLE